MELRAPHDEPVIVFRRAFSAPARLVFEAWTEPGHLRRWRGPRGFELVACEVGQGRPETMRKLIESARPPDL